MRIFNGCSFLTKDDIVGDIELPLDDSEQSIESVAGGHSPRPGVKFCVSDIRQKSRMALENRADSGLNPLITESHGGQNGMRAGTA